MARQLGLWDDAPVDETELVQAALKSVEELRALNAIPPWKEVDAAIVLELARSVMTSHGIAKSNMTSTLLAAIGNLPEPIVTEAEDVVQYEADRELEWVRRHAPADPADVPDATESAPVQ